MVKPKKRFNLGERRQSERLKEKRLKQQLGLGEQQYSERRRSERIREKRRNQLSVKRQPEVKKRRLNNGKRQYSSLSSAASKFMSFVTDDILEEILLRLPDSRSVIESGFVCKRWFSLVSRRTPQKFSYFLRKFNHHHRLKRHQEQQKRDQHKQQQQLPYTLLMRGYYHTSGTGLPYIYFPTIPRLDFLSDKSKILHHGTTSTTTATGGGGGGGGSYLDFLSLKRGCILSSFDDLLMIRPTPHNFYICNPLTKQWIMLPKKTIQSKNRKIYRCGFVCKPNCCCNKLIGVGSDSYYCNCSVKYRVVLIMNAASSNSTVSTVSIFSSETGQWSKSKLQFRHSLYSWHVTSVGHNGFIYWGYGEDDLKGIVAFDAFKDVFERDEQRCRLIGLPLQFGRGRLRGQSVKARLGVVRGRLRLSQFYFLRRSNAYVLKAWELDRLNYGYWRLVHHVSFKRRDESMVLFLVALHPEDGNAFFFTSRDKDGFYHDLFRYEIGRDDYKLVCRCKTSLCVFPLVHPWWPTTIPSLLPST